MELLGDVDRVESCFGLFGDSVSVVPFGDSANIHARYVHGLHRKYHSF
jgi:hypothetical protein